MRASQVIPAAPSDPPTTPMSLVRSLARRYLFVLLAVAILVIVDQAIIQPLLVRLNFYAPAINVAGRQRMLSQKVTKESLALATGSVPQTAAERRDALWLAIEQWITAHRGLLEGSHSLGLEPIADPPIADALRALEPKLLAIRSAAVQIATSDVLPDQAKLGGTIAPALNSILTEEPRYLEGMEQVVGMLEVSAGRQVDFLRWCGLAAMLTVLVLLVGVHFVVLRPAMNLIRDQIAQLTEGESRYRVMAELLAESRDELELRVTERTSELVATNRALDYEIAERQAAEMRMRELSAELAHASRVTALGQMATGLAHEINQPLASITNYAEVLELSIEQGAIETAQSRSTIAHLKQAALRAGQIVRRMRNFVRSGSGLKSAVQLNTLVRDVCDLCRPHLDQANIRLTAELSDSVPTVIAEALEIQQVLVNLVQNAAQALEECSRGQRQIDIRTYSDSDSAGVEVADTGPGFPTESADDSFTPFFSTKPEGLGMGLAISRTILERSQGRLWGENRGTGGAVVRFCLPLAPRHESQANTSTDCLCR